VLIFTLLVSAIIFMLAVSFSTLVTLESKTIASYNYANLALHAADAGFQRGFIDLVNKPWADLSALVVTPPGTSYTLPPGKTQLYDADGVITYYTVETSDPVPNTPEGGNFGNVEPTGTRGYYRWQLTVTSIGEVALAGNPAEIIARRTIRARISLQRPQQDITGAPAPGSDDYQGYGKILNWSEANR
jgi:hypothetical protein